MSVWLTIPSARPPAVARVCINAWKAQGYKVAVVRDQVDDLAYEADHPIIGDPYSGYSKSCN